MYRNAHAAIRANPAFNKKPVREDIKPKRYVHFSANLAFLTSGCYV